jgi:hypothetical protein
MDQIGNIVDFEENMVSVAINKICCGRVKAAIDNT